MMLKHSLRWQVFTRLSHSQTRQVLLLPRPSLREQYQMLLRHSSKQQMLMGLSHQAQGRLLEEIKCNLRGYSRVMLPMQSCCSTALTSPASRGSMGSSRLQA